SRSRNTRKASNWSSDVCSSDLGRLLACQTPARATLTETAYPWVCWSPRAGQPERGLRHRPRSAGGAHRASGASTQARCGRSHCFGIKFRPMLLSLDWMNLFGGLSSGQVTSVIVVAVIFTAASGLTLLSLIAF